MSPLICWEADDDCLVSPAFTATSGARSLFMPHSPQLLQHDGPFH